MRASLILVGGFVAFAAACGGDDSVSIDTNDKNVCSEIAEVACHNLYSCCTEGEIESYLRVSEPRSELQCRDDVQRSCERSTAALAGSIKEGRMRFEPETMNTCLSALIAPADGTCAEVVPELPWTEACMNSAWVGTVPTDGACFSSPECADAPDTFCAPSQKCIARPGSGQPCGGGCASAFYCSVGRCAAKLPAGGRCTSSPECQKGLFCDTSGPMPVCTAPGGAGAACTGSAACKSGECIPGTCSGTTSNSCYRDTDCNGRCADDNSFCSTASQCAIGSCMVSGAPCSTQGACGPTDTCVFPVACLPGDCVGEPVCTDGRFTVDYCDDAVSQLPGL